LGAVWFSNAGTNRVQQGSGASPGKSGVPPLPARPTATNPSAAHLAVLSAFPNPAQDELRIQFALTQSLTLQFHLVDAQGRTMKGMSTTQTLGAGTHLVSLDVSGLANGVYYLQLQNAGQPLRTLPVYVRR
jgi:hypothetical protein